MNKLDIIIFFIVLIPALIGFKNGLIKSIFALIALILGLFIAAKTYDTAATVFSSIGFGEKFSFITAFISVMLIIYFIIMFIAGKISSFGFFTKSIDRSLGLVLGIGKGLIAASIFLLFATRILSFFINDIVEESKLYPFVVEAAPVTFNFISETFLGSDGFFEDVKGLIIKDGIEPEGNKK